jgi:hypothetical protein
MLITQQLPTAAVLRLASVCMNLHPTTIAGGLEAHGNNTLIFVGYLHINVHTRTCAPITVHIPVTELHRPHRPTRPSQWKCPDVYQEVVPGQQAVMQQ